MSRSEEQEFYKAQVAHGKTFAFPRPDVPQYGMTLRDWFAGQALTGVVATVNSSSQVMALCIEARKRGLETEEYIAESAFAIADAMLAERAKP